MFVAVIVEFDIPHNSITIHEPRYFETKENAKLYCLRTIQDNTRELVQIYDDLYIDENYIYEYRIDKFNPDRIFEY